MHSVPGALPTPGGSGPRVLLALSAALPRPASAAWAIAAPALKVVAGVTLALAWIGGIAALLWGTVSWFAEVQVLPPPGFAGWPQ
jgi:hypothetical protein